MCEEKERIWYICFNRFLVLENKITNNILAVYIHTHTYSGSLSNSLFVSFQTYFCCKTQYDRCQIREKQWTWRL